MDCALQDKEVAHGGTAPRMLCLDDYFVVEIERVVTDPETGKKVKRMVIIFNILFINNDTAVGSGCLSIVWSLLRPTDTREQRLIFWKIKGNNI